MNEREFIINTHWINEKCMVCKEKFKIGEKIILCPIQKIKIGWGNVISIPIHTKCYWVDKDDI